MVTLVGVRYVGGTLGGGAGMEEVQVLGFVYQANATIRTQGHARDRRSLALRPRRETKAMAETEGVSEVCF